MLKTIERKKPEKERVLQIRGHLELFPVWGTGSEIRGQTRQLAATILPAKIGTIVTVHRGAAAFCTILGRMLGEIAPDFAYIDVPIIAKRTWNNELAGPPRIYADHVEPEEEIRNRNVLILDDIYDSGETLRKVIDLIWTYKPASVRTAVLVTKGVPGRGQEPDFSLFSFPAAPEGIAKEYWFCGYGMDFDLQYRNLEDIIEVRYAKTWTASVDAAMEHPRVALKSL